MMTIRYINKNEFEYSNIINWHKKGYTGKGIKIANMESCNPDAWCHDGKIVNPFNHQQKKFENSHGNQTANILHQIAPDSEIHILSNGGSYINGKVEGRFIDESIPYMIKTGIHLVNASLSGINNDVLNKNIKKAQKHGTVFCNAAGNESDRGTGGYANSGVWIVTGAVHLSRKGKVNLASYSSIGEAVDFVQFSGIYAEDIRQWEKDYPIHVMGTSFASPMMCGMLALVQQFFLEKAGRALYQDEIYQFILDNTIDLGEEGKDVEYGHGLFVLPNPDEIDINKYINKNIKPDDNSNTKPDENIKEEDNMKFADVPEGKWSEKNIDLVSDLGIMKGYPDGTFQPTKTVTREELATVLANLVNNFDIRRK
jgi:hypothetical protein